MGGGQGGEAWAHILTCSVLTWSLVCTKDSSCSSAWPGPSFSLTGVGSVAAWASSSATCVERMVSTSLGNLLSAQSRPLCMELPPKPGREDFRSDTPLRWALNWTHFTEHETKEVTYRDHTASW